MTTTIIASIWIISIAVTAICYVYAFSVCPKEAWEACKVPWWHWMLFCIAAIIVAPIVATSCVYATRMIHKYLPLIRKADNC